MSDSLALNARILGAACVKHHKSNALSGEKRDRCPDLTGIKARADAPRRDALARYDRKFQAPGEVTAPPRPESKR
jgi:hypothetical protein